MNPDLPILPISVFAPIPWFSLANEGATVDMWENYPKQTFRNRFRILSANGIQTLTIPVEGQKGLKTATKEIKLSAGSWPKQHLAAIRSAYGRSAYFEHFFPEIELIYSQKSTFLFDLALQTNSLFKKYKLLGELHYSDFSFPHEAKLTNDFRNCFEPSFEWPILKPYVQVFSDRYPFVGGLSGLDLLMNLGPRGTDYLLLIKKDCLGVSKSSSASSLL